MSVVAVVLLIKNWRSSEKEWKHAFNVVSTKIHILVLASFYRAPVWQCLDSSTERSLQQIINSLGPVSLREFLICHVKINTVDDSWRPVSERAQKCTAKTCHSDFDLWPRKSTPFICEILFKCFSDIVFTSVKPKQSHSDLDLWPAKDDQLTDVAFTQ